MNWNYLIFGAIIAAGGAAYAIYRHKASECLSFEDYCSECTKAADKEFITYELTDNVAKAALILGKVDDHNMAPYIYCRYKDGRVTKKRVGYKEYSINLCPLDVQEKGEYFIKKY